YSSNSGVCPGSTQPDGLRMCATLTAAVFELTRPTYSSICFGRVPAARMRVGWVTCSGMEPRERRRGREHGRLVPGELVETPEHRLEVAEVLASQAGERRQELPALGVLEEQAHRRRSRLLLAVGVVEQDLVQALERALDPRAARLRGEAEHPTLRPRAAARAQRAREPRTRPRPAPSAPRGGGYQATTPWSTGSERQRLKMRVTPAGREHRPRARLSMLRPACHGPRPIGILDPTDRSGLKAGPAARLRDSRRPG